MYSMLLEKDETQIDFSVRQRIFCKMISYLIVVLTKGTCKLLILPSTCWQCLAMMELTSHNFLQECLSVERKYDSLMTKWLDNPRSIDLIYWYKCLRTLLEVSWKSSLRFLRKILCVFFLFCSVVKAIRNKRSNTLGHRLLSKLTLLAGSGFCQIFKN